MLLSSSLWREELFCEERAAQVVAASSDSVRLILSLNYTLITDNLIVGSQPQKPKDIDHFKKEEGVTYILNLQQDKDVEYWGIDLKSITRRCHELDVRHMRRPIKSGSSTEFLNHFQNGPVWVHGDVHHRCWAMLELVTVIPHFPQL
ncbi:Phosphoglucan phosphatase LSF2 [Arachis hypogaea]|nr:Phosphoglucan phosphatase LSF2 [Arachis hypogaea]